MAGNSNFKELVEFKSNYPEFSQQCRTRHFVKFHDFNFANYDIFCRLNDVTNFAFSIMGYLMSVSDDLVTQISKLKKIMKYVYPLKRYNILKFYFCY